MTAAGAPGSALARVVERLEARGFGPVRGGMCRCPSHADSHASLAVNQGERGAVLWCHAGCSTDAVLRALDMQTAELFDDAPAPKRGNGRDHGQTRQRVAEYLYVDRDGAPLARKVRYEPGFDGRDKSFAWEILDADEDWRTPNKKKGESGNPNVLYRLPELAQTAGHVHFCEGEKAVDRIHEAGGIATCTPTISAPTPEILARLRDRDVIVWQDRDEPGRKQAAAAVAALRGIAKSVRTVQSATTEEGDDAYNHLQAGFTLEDAVEIDGPIEIPKLALDLDAIRARPRGASPLPGLLPEEPALIVMPARPKVGKSRFATSLAQAASAGVPPWPDAPVLELGPVAIVSAEESGSDIVWMLDALAAMADPRRPRWQDRLLVYARDPLLDQRVAALLCLDAEGLGLLRELARECGLIVLDSLSRIKPRGIEEIDNDQMTALLDALQQIATGERCYLVLLHHEGHADRDDPVSAGRGASAISAVARAVWHLDRVAGSIWLRRLRVRGNAVPDSEMTFAVATPETQPEGAILYWLPQDPLRRVSIEDVLPEIGSECSSGDLARHLSGCGADEKPTGQAGREAAHLRERWRREGLIEVVKGPRNSKLLRRLL